MATLEELFVRFAQRGDLDALSEVFDGTAEQLLRTAAHCASSEAAAEDLVQDTFVAAIECAREFDPARALLPWLAGILANKAKEARRDGRRAPPPAREQVVPHPVETAQGGELQSALRSALARVDELYREPLRLRLCEGRSTPDIARQLARSPGAVRVQIHRGLERLKKLLPPGLALGVAALLPARGLADVKTAVLARAGARVTTGVSFLSGMLVMKTLWVAAAAVVAVGAGCWVWAEAHSARQQQVTGTELTPLPSQVAVQPEPQEPATRMAEPRRSAVLLPQERGDGANPAAPGPVLVAPFTVRVVVLDAATKPVPEAVLELRDARPQPRTSETQPAKPGSKDSYGERDQEPAALLRVQTDAEGKKTITSDRELAFVRASKPGGGDSGWFALAESRRSDPTELVLELRRFIPVHGLVLRGDTPIPDAQVELQTRSWRKGFEESAAPQGIRSDRDGRFELELPDRSGWDIVARKDGQSTRWAVVDLPGRTLVKEHVLRFPDAFVIRGMLLAPDGKPHAGTVQAHAVKEGSGQDTDGDTSWHGTGVNVKSDGAFNLPFARAGRYRVLASLKDGGNGGAGEGLGASDPCDVEVGPNGGPGELVLRLHATGTVRGSVRNKDASPVADAVVSLGLNASRTPEQAARPAEWPTVGDLYLIGEAPTARTDSSGSFVLRGLHPRARYELRCHPDPKRRSIYHVMPGIVTAGMKDIEFTLGEPAVRTGSVILQVVGRDGAPVREFSYSMVEQSPAGGSSQSNSVRVNDPQGRHVIADLPMGREYQIAVEVAGGLLFLTTPFVFEQDGIVVTARVPVPGAARVHVLDSDGKPARHVGVNATLLPGVVQKTSPPQRTDQDGYATIPDLVPGTYRVGAYLGSHGREQQAEIRAGETLEIELRLAK